MTQPKIIVISGPPCSGKTYFINQIKKSQTIRNNLTISSDFKVINANLIRKEKTIPEYHKSLLIHYDCLRNFKRNLSYEKSNDPFLEIIKELKIDKIIFLVNKSHELTLRMEDRICRLQGSISKERLDKLKRLKKLYLNSKQLNEEYLKWYDFCSTQIDSQLCSWSTNSLKSNVSPLTLLQPFDSNTQLTI